MKYLVVIAGTMIAILILAKCLFAEEVIDVNRLVKAIYIAEGGENAKKPFGVLSVPCSTFSGCERICRNTVRNNIKRWKKAGEPTDFISFLGARYAPRSSHPLNANWIPNVRRIYGKISGSV
jgi:hypothetical protein